MAYKNKKGATAMKEKGAMAYKEGPMAYKKGPMASKQSPAEHYAMNARHDMKTGEGTKADIAYDIKKASEYGYMTSADKVHRHRRGATAMMDKGATATTPTEKGIKGLGSSNKSEGKYI